MNFTPDDWNTPMASGGMPWDGQFYIEMARNLEHACFDYIMIEDTLMVSEVYGGSMDAYLKHARLDGAEARPRAAASDHGALDEQARRGGDDVHEFLPAVHARPPVDDARPHRRRPLRLEHRHLRRGRLREELRHGQALRARPALRHEYLELMCKLWDSWEPDAVIRDRETGTYADPTKVHTIDFEGKFYKSRGPLNTVPCG
jgi:hypothetical protein